MHPCAVHVYVYDNVRLRLRNPPVAQGIISYNNIPES